MRASIVISTYNRSASLATTLDALLHQTHDDFEVIVVNGPSTDETAALLEQRGDAVRALDCPEANLSKSRNVGIDAAAGEIVAFIDDDAVPEPRWLEELLEPYRDEAVGGSGGRVLDNSGVRPQYRYSLCDRVGITDFHKQPPFDEYNRPGADPFVYLQGTNASFRRRVLEEIQGFDEEIEYNYDEAEVCLRAIDAGWKLEALEGAVVHHKFLPSHMRRSEGRFTDPYMPLKNRAYFALRNGAGRYSQGEIFRSLLAYVEGVHGWAGDCAITGEFSEEEHRHFLDRADSGFALGVERGLRGERRSHTVAPARPEQFLPYPVPRPRRRLAICLVSLDYPPKPVGGIGRYTHDLARGLAGGGHEVHVVTRDDDRPYRVDFEEGAWVHRFPLGERRLPALEGQPLAGNLAHLAAVYGAVRHVQERFGLDVVSGSNWIAEPLLCAFDPRFATVLVCSTPMRTVAETQPLIAAQEHTPWQVKLEDAALRRIEHLVPVSEANRETLRAVPGVDADAATVVHHGIEDMRELHPRTRPDDGVVEILFVGRLEPRKGVDTLLEAAIELMRSRPHLRLRLCGADAGYASGRSYEDWLAERLESEPELLERFSFEGEVPDDRLYRLYADADVFCAPSRYESFGLVLAEAMMMGRPVVACRAGGMSEVVADGVTGTLVAPGDVDELRAALSELVDDAGLRERYGRAARERFEREFRNEIAVGRLEAHYLEIAAKRAGSPASPAAAEEAVRSGAAELLGELAGMAPQQAGQAAADLLAERAFPVDYEALIAPLMGLPDREFVNGLYEAMLGRVPDEPGLAGHLGALAAGRPRAQLVRDVAESDEAQDLGIDPRWFEGVESRLPEPSRAAAGRRSLKALANRAVLRLARPVLTELERRQGVLFEAMGQHADTVADRLAALNTRLEGVHEEVGRARDRAGELNSRVDVLQRKQEGMALDLRERLPSQPEPAELPAPVIVDPEGFEARLEELGGELRVNLGCGEKPLPGYINVDFRPLPGVDVVADVRRLPFEPGSVREIMSAHLVEHFRQHQLATNLLPHWRALLRPDGELRTITPNWTVLIAQLNDGRLSFADFKTVTFGLQDYSGDDHFAMYSPETLMELLGQAGFGSFEVLATDRQNGLSPEMEIVARPEAGEPHVTAQPSSDRLEVD